MRHQWRKFVAAQNRQIGTLKKKIAELEGQRQQAIVDYEDACRDLDKLTFWAVTVRDSLVNAAQQYSERSLKYGDTMAELSAMLVRILCHEAHGLDRGLSQIKKEEV